MLFSYLFVAIIFFPTYIVCCRVLAPDWIQVSCQKYLLIIHPPQTKIIFRGAMGDEGGEQGPEEGDEHPCPRRDVPCRPGHQGPPSH